MDGILTGRVETQTPSVPTGGGHWLVIHATESPTDRKRTETFTEKHFTWLHLKGTKSHICALSALYPFRLFWPQRCLLSLWHDRIRTCLWRQKRTCFFTETMMMHRSRREQFQAGTIFFHHTKGNMQKLADITALILTSAVSREWASYSNAEASLPLCIRRKKVEPTWNCFQHILWLIFLVGKMSGKGHYCWVLCGTLSMTSKVSSTSIILERRRLLCS